MLILIKCMTCNKMLADKWKYYENECKKLDEENMDKSTDNKDLKNMDPKNRGKILDDLGITRMCCRRCMLGCVDMMDRI